MFVDFLFQDIISAPSADEYKVELQARQSRQRFGRRLANLGGAVRDSISLASNTIAPLLPIVKIRKKQLLPQQLFSRMSSNIMEHFTVKDATIRTVPPTVVRSYALTSMILKNMFADTDSNLAEDKVEGGSQGQAATGGAHQLNDSNYVSFQAFYTKLYLQNMLLTGDERIEFQERWGFDSEYDTLNSESSIFKEDNVIPAGVADKIRNHLYFCFTRRRTRRQILSEAIDETYHFSNEKIRKLKVASDIQVGLEIMHLFIIDLLG